MRVLFLAPYLPTPGSGGRTRLVNLMQRFAARHEVRLCAFAAEEQVPEDSPYDGVALPARAPVSPPTTVAFWRARVTDPLPLFASYMRDEAMVDAVARTCSSWKPDVVFVNTSEMGQYLDAVPPGPTTVLDFQDVASRWVGRSARIGSSKQRLLNALDAFKTRRFEARVGRRADIVLATAPVECAFLRTLGVAGPIEVPNGVDTTAFTPMPSVAEEPDRLLFVGPLTSDSNMVAMRWFCDRVLPLLPATVHVDVVGAPAGSWPSQVRLLGRVPDVREHLAAAPVSIVPIQVGSGTRYKILEALSMARAVVSTTIGAEGLGLTDGEQIVLADDPTAFARGCTDLLASSAKRATLGAAGREHVVARFDWSILVATIERALAAAGRS